MQIRNADSGDLDQLTDFIVRVQGIHVDACPAIFAPLGEQPVRKFLDDCLSAGSPIIRVADRNSTVPGFTLLAVHELSGSLIRLPRKLVYVDLIAVDPQYQRSGVGSALILDALEIAKSRGIGRIELDVMGFNESAHRFFESQGFSTLGVKMVREVAAD